MTFNHTFRTCFPSGITVEFLPSTESSSRVVILCDGLPSVPSKKDVLRHLSDSGFWCFHLRYRGTWESHGSFLSESPEKDIDILIGELFHEFQDVWSGRRFRIDSPMFFVIGSSFGGTTATLASLNQRVSKVVAIAPVSDWRQQYHTEPLPYLKRVIEDGFGPVYRFKLEDWQKLESGNFFNPALVDREFDSKKLMIIHAQDDPIVHISQSILFCQKHGLRLVKLPQGGHLSVSDVLYSNMWQSILQFLTQQESQQNKKRWPSPSILPFA